VNQPARPAFRPGSPAGLPHAAAQPPRPANPGRPHAPQPAGPGTPQRPYAPPARPVAQPPYAPPAPPRPRVPQPPMPQPPVAHPPVARPPAPPARPAAPRPAAQRPAAPRPAAPAPRPVAPVAVAAPSAPPAALPPVPPAAQPEPLGPPPRPRKSKVGRWIALLVIAGGIGGAVWYGTHTAPASAAVGDCVSQTGSDSLAKVSCGDKSAQFKVQGRLENKTIVDASLDACAAFPTATSAYWEGEDGKPGLVLCLAPVVPVATPGK
jgi:hypothetical protein